MLSTAQQYALDTHLRETNLLMNEELIQELTDHFTTAIDDEIERFGLSFNTALLLVQQSFGDRKAMQQMEREYNNVTFRHYDARWEEAVRLHFQRPLLWWPTLPAFAVLLLVSYASYVPKTTDGTTWEHFSGGFIFGLLLGVLVLMLSTGWKYMLKVIRYGVHNVPTETLYLLTRHAMWLLVLYGTGIVGHAWLLPLFPVLVQPFLVAIYLTAFGLYVRTGQMVYETLYNTYSTR